MKKYLFAALALTALVACSKDDDPTLTSSKKSVVISIANMASNTRAVDSEATATQQGGNIACTSINENFYILFLDSDNVVKAKYVGTDLSQFGGSEGKYVFNSLASGITKVAAVGNLKTPYTIPVIGNDLDNTDFIPAWNDEARAIKSAYTDIVVYAISDLEDSQQSLNNVPVYEASLTIAPQFARIEVTQISCTDFGATVNTTLGNVGYDAIGINSITLLNGNEYNDAKSYRYTFGNFTTDALFEDGSTPKQYVLVPDLNLTDGQGTEVLSAGGDMAWSWNITPQAVSNLVTDLYVSGNGYTAIAPERTVTIESYKTGDPAVAIDTFEAGNIYRFAIDFSHENIDDAGNHIIVNVKVTASPWVVNNVDVGFATN